MWFNLWKIWSHEVPWHSDFSVWYLKEQKTGNAEFLHSKIQLKGRSGQQSPMEFFAKIEQGQTAPNFA